MTEHEEKRAGAAFGSTNPAFGAKGPSDLPSSPPLTFVASLFLLLIFGAPIGQAIWEKAHERPLQALAYLAPFARDLEGRTAGAWAKELALELASEPRLRRFEHDLHDASFVKHELLPWYQLAVTALFGHGNEKAVTGRDGWLFFADDLASAYGRGYLQPGRGGVEALAAIDDFKRQLDARGIQLLLIPSYSKEMLDPEMLARSTSHLTTALNPDLPRFYAELERRGLDFMRMDELFADRRLEMNDPEARLALPRDTHWTPETMAWCARRIAQRALDLLGEAGPQDGAPSLFTTIEAPIDGDGDLLRMLALPEGQTLFPKMRLTLTQVIDAATRAPAQPDPESDVLLMGDSLSKIYSTPDLRLGQGAGLPEHLMLRMNRPLDVIALPGGSATATREVLARRNDGKGGLAGKRLVIWQFGVRMLAAGPQEWQLIEMPPPLEDGSEPLHVDPSVPRDRITILGEIVETSTIPKGFGYDLALTTYEYKVLEVLDGKLEGDRVWVAFPAIVDYQDTPARSFPVGTKHKLVLEDVRLHHDLEDTYNQDDTDAGKVIHFPVQHEDAR